MSKILKVVVAGTVVCLILATSVVALAAPGNVGTVESAWLNFQKVLGEQRVANGDTTKEKADENYAKMLEKCEESEEDVIYNHERRGKMNGRFGIVKTYAEVSGQDAKEILELLKNGEKNIWQIAEEAGKFTAFKTAVVADIDEKITKTNNAELIEKLNEHKAGIVAMKSAADAPKRSQVGPRGKSGGRSRFGDSDGNGQGKAS